MVKRPGRCKNISTSYGNGNPLITYTKVLPHSVTPLPSLQESRWTLTRRSQLPFVHKIFPNLLLKNVRDVLGKNCVIAVDNRGIMPRTAQVKPLPRHRR